MTKRFLTSITLLLALAACGDNEVTTPPAPGTPAAPGAPGTPTPPPAAAPGTPKPAPAVGANIFNVNGQPNFEERALNVGFTPDPAVIQVVSGGNLDASEAHIPGQTCRGWVTARPDVNIRVAAPMPFLRMFMTAQGSEDTTIIVNKPDGSWLCADDVYGMNPGVDIPMAAPGLYNVWVGSYTNGTQAHGTLSVTTSNVTTPNGVGTPLNPAGTPNFGTRALGAGFTPAAVDVTSGGNIEARNSAAGGTCRGYITAQPDVNLMFAAASSNVRVFIDNARNNADTTLVIQLPDGTYRCDDDTNGNSPQIDFPQAAAGTYHVWVGSYQSGVQAHARLNIQQGAAAGGGGK